MSGPVIDDRLNVENSDVSFEEHHPIGTPDRRMTTPLTKPLKRELQIQGRPFVVTLSAEGIKLTVKGKRKGQELRWEDLVSGEAALAVALNAS